MEHYILNSSPRVRSQSQLDEQLPPPPPPMMQSLSPLYRSPQMTDRRTMDSSKTPPNLSPSSTVSLSGSSMGHLNVQANAWVPEQYSPTRSHGNQSIFDTATTGSSDISAEGRHRDIEAHIVINTVKNSWMCKLCRKTFKQRKDIEQHLHSGTHDDVRFTCADCGKGFASLGSITLHIEQAGHSNKQKLLQDVHLMATDNVFGSSASSFPTSSQKALASVGNKYGSVASPSSAYTGVDSDTYSPRDQHDLNLESFQNMRLDTSGGYDGRHSSRLSTPVDSPRYSFNPPRSAQSSNKSSYAASQKSNLFSPAHDASFTPYQSAMYQQSGKAVDRTTPQNRFSLNFDSLRGSDSHTPLSTLSSRAHHAKSSPRSATMRSVDSYKSGVTDMSSQKQFSAMNSFDSALSTPSPWHSQSMNHHHQQPHQMQQSHHRHAYEQQKYPQVHTPSFSSNSPASFRGGTDSAGTSLYNSPRPDPRSDPRPDPRSVLSGHDNSARSPLDPLERAILHLDADNTPDGTPRTPPGLSASHRPSSSLNSSSNSTNSDFLNISSKGTLLSDSIREQKGRYYLHIGSYSEKHLLEAGCCFVLTDEAQMAVLEDSFVISQFHTGSMQPEYEALCKGLSKALEMGIRNIKMYAATEEFFIQLSKGKSFCHLDPYISRLYDKVVLLCQKFHYSEILFAQRDSYSREMLLSRMAFKNATVSKLSSFDLSGAPSTGVNDTHSMFGF